MKAKKSRLSRAGKHYISPLPLDDAINHMMSLSGQGITVWFERQNDDQLTFTLDTTLSSGDEGHLSGRIQRWEGTKTQVTITTFYEIDPGGWCGLFVFAPAAGCFAIRALVDTSHTILASTICFFFMIVLSYYYLNSTNNRAKDPLHNALIKNIGLVELKHDSYETSSTAFPESPNVETD
ncbi:MAG: hypothetical protein ACPG7F_07365 [Aggregatilineales bacterium]